MRTLALLHLVVGLVTLVLGIVGMVNANSAVSLASGVVCGVGLVASGLATQRGSTKAMWTGFVIALTILGWFCAQLIVGNGTKYPAIILTALSGVVIIVTLLLQIQPKTRERIF